MGKLITFPLFLAGNLKTRKMCHSKSNTYLPRKVLYVPDRWWWWKKSGTESEERDLSTKVWMLVFGGAMPFCLQDSQNFLFTFLPPRIDASRHTHISRSESNAKLYRRLWWIMHRQHDVIWDFLPWLLYSKCCYIRSTYISNLSDYVYTYTIGR